jgi:hypothetical protein
MRGIKVSRSVRKDLDMVILAVRFGNPDELSIVQACQRRGFVWGDVELLSREELIMALQNGKRAATGRKLDRNGDFEIFSPIKLRSRGDGDVLVIEGADAAKGDSLERPLF